MYPHPQYTHGEPITKVPTKTPANNKIFMLYNTGSRRKEAVGAPDKVITIYACGPTVYNYVHIGNFRTFIVEDILRRSLRFFGYELCHVMNITDVGHLSDDGDHGEDKMLMSAREQGRSAWEIAEYFTKVFMEDSAHLNIEKPEVICRATDHIPDMIDMISILQEKGYTYEAGGNVYFDVGKFPDYGKMARLSDHDQQARVGLDGGKRNPRDFVLWFTKSKFDNHAMVWDSPWGKGYPGWHIECSAMSRRYHGDQFDIHCGGTDLIPIHHSNEIAQSEAVSGKSPWVRFWFHSAFLLFNRSKMSRSSGSFLTLTELRNRGNHALDYRYLVLGANYRTQLHFSDESLAAASTARLKLRERMRSICEVEPAENLGTHAQTSLDAFREALADDLNTPRALAELWTLTKNNAISLAEKRRLIACMDQVLGLNLEVVAEIEEVKLGDDIQGLIDERNSARKQGNFARADEIRRQLTSLGLVLTDTPDGTRWEKNL